jgi:hypothetical protein
MGSLLYWHRECWTILFVRATLKLDCPSSFLDPLNFPGSISLSTNKTIYIYVFFILYGYNISHNMMVTVATLRTKPISKYNIILNNGALWRQKGEFF